MKPKCTCILVVPNKGVECCLGPEGNGVSLGKRVREGQALQTRSEIKSLDQK
jgi:hypothetical protein